MKRKKIRILFAGGGTGGHLFPAVAVAEQVRMLEPDADILFVGTKKKIESEVVPRLGFRFAPIWIKGFARKLSWENILFPLKLVVSLLQSLFIAAKFRPQVVVGSGGYASGPAVYCAHLLKAKVVLLEQNSFPGVTTKILAKYADEIHISFEDSKKYFADKSKVFFTGNPVRESLVLVNREEAIKKLGLNPAKKIIFVSGGSLGAKSINKTISLIAGILEDNGYQLIWQTGKNYFEEYKYHNSLNIKVFPFIDDMQICFSACDLMISRAGATTIAEVLVLGIPVLFIPSPNVAENHQYYNAKSLTDKNAAEMILDSEVKDRLLNKIIELFSSEGRLETLKKSAKLSAKTDAANRIAKNVLQLVKKV